MTSDSLPPQVPVSVTIPILIVTIILILIRSGGDEEDGEYD